MSTCSFSLFFLSILNTVCHSSLTQSLLIHLIGLVFTVLPNLFLVTCLWHYTHCWLVSLVKATFSWFAELWYISLVTETVTQNLVGLLWALFLMRPRLWTCLCILSSRRFRKNLAKQFRDNPSCYYLITLDIWSNAFSSSIPRWCLIPLSCLQQESC